MSRDRPKRAALRSTRPPRQLRRAPERSRPRRGRWRLAGRVSDHVNVGTRCAVSVLTSPRADARASARGEHAALPMIPPRDRQRAPRDGRRRSTAARETAWRCRCSCRPVSGPIAGLVTAAQHGEEAETGLLARRLMERVPGTETRWAVVQCLNPDGLLAGTRQNAAGVDLNRNFPSPTWRPDPSFTYPPGIERGRRVLANRTNRSSPGAQAGSEPETQATMALVERLQPPLVVDLHSPLELILVRGTPPAGVAEALGAAADVPLELRARGPRAGVVRRLAGAPRHPSAGVRGRARQPAGALRPAPARAGGAPALVAALPFRPTGRRVRGRRARAARVDAAGLRAAAALVAAAPLSLASSPPVRSRAQHDEPRGQPHQRPA